jgi:hypothetical protein
MNNRFEVTRWHDVIIITRDKGGHEDSLMILVSEVKALVELLEGAIS